VNKRFRVAAVLLFVAAASSAVVLLTKSSGTPAFTRHAAEQQGRAFAQHDQDLFSKKQTGDKEGPASYADQVAELRCRRRSHIPRLPIPVLDEGPVVAGAATTPERVVLTDRPAVGPS